ncbi:hypothetical protein FRB93_012799 [Tulasnella sp. JGI-2019a]|nr:hypothetical protein FRB93_012799 [Tulasnella sp. JGI-2019a]
MPPLDQNLFTLKIRRSESGEANALDLVDAQDALHYQKRSIPPAAAGEPGPEGPPLYDIWDPLSNSLLATMHAVPVTEKKKRTVLLHNPTVQVEMTFTGKINFRWQFTWEDNTFEFKRDECFLLRHPDPPVLVAVFDFERKRDKIDIGLIQLMDYNLTRFDIDDRKGLEVVMITGLLSFQDQVTGVATQSDSASGTLATPSGTGMLSRLTSFQASNSNNSNANPMSPMGQSGDQLVAGLQMREKSQPNEVLVTSLFDVNDYAEYAVKLLNDPNLLYIVIRSQTEDEVSKVVTIASLAKRMRYKGGAYEEELHQYVRYDEAGAGKAGSSKGPKVIKLDGPPAGKDPAKEYRPPTALTIHLSKIPMPELQPAPREPERPSAAGGHGHGRSTRHVNEAQSSSSGRSGRSSSAQRESELRPPAHRDGGHGGSNGKSSKLRKDSDNARHGRSTSPMPPLPPQSGALNSGPPPNRGRVASESGTVSPRTAFQGFFNPGHMVNSSSGGQSHSSSRPRPPPPGSYESMPISPSQNVPGSFPSFPQPETPPPPPPPASQGGLGSFVGGLIPHGRFAWK